MKYLNYLLILLGAIIAMYANHSEEQNQYILIGGISILMIGVYRTSRNIPSKLEKDEDDSLKQQEHEV
ncbi:hypothetical protein ACFFU9_12455 [Mariniflexile ostreae]|uniref:Uncharacterized protein n=1 Tax=Mariniflexile ostreae TaxID=1520892 RepID=A0ABV5FDL0_9FLAO